ncbi:hypothetical protein [Bacillus sp. REN16]|uniref:hypothetical protein n=1 Tax=Bacillus sp. REN16 TaxID=2887296 RepID=UPI001E3B809E|nr:hypothetical protein [Bacillus sp. REN16]MCC3358199.1 hypothetical protein [Bacillus sp. REN16]
MNNNFSEKRPIVVRATPEMANWMHPQDDKRKQLIQERVEAAKARFSQRKRQPEKLAYSLQKKKNSIPVIGIKVKTVSVTELVSSKKIGPKSDKKLRRVQLEQVGKRRTD